MNKKTLLVLFICLCGWAWTAVAEILKIQSGDWKFKLDKDNGDLRDVTYRGEIVFPKLSRGQIFNGKTINSFTLKKYEMVDSGKELRLDLTAPGFELTENYRFEAWQLPGLLKRDAELRSTDKQPVLFGSWIPQTQVQSDLEYYMPAALLGDVRNFTDERIRYDYQVPQNLTATAWRWKGNLKDLPVGTRLTPSESGGRIILLRTPQGTAVSVLNDERRECVRPVIVKENQKCTELRLSLDCEGWLLPEQPQKIGSSYLYVQLGRSIKQALDHIHDWYRVIGATIPADRPSWVEKQMVYEFRVDHGMSPNDLDIIEHEIVPRIKGMNYTLTYIQPVAEGRGCYLPLHHRELAMTIGTQARYKTFLSTLKKNDIRIWQDIVPHGSNRKDLETRGNSVFQMAILKDGQVNPYLYIADYLNPEWQNYMKETAAFWSKELPLDGFRIDMPYGSPRNFRREGFPDKKPELVNEEWWQRSLKQAGGKAPALEYERASLPTRLGGLEMVKNIRTEARKNNPDAAVLAEVLEPFQSVTSDVIYDLLYAMLENYLNLKPELFAPGLSRYFEEREKIALPGQLWLRVFQSHDAPPTYGLLGTAAGNGFYAACVLSRGLPMLDKYMDIGHGNFISRLQLIRKNRPELNFGHVDYTGVKAAPGVWTVLHKKDGQCSIGLVNFTNREQDNHISLTPAEMGLKTGRYALINAMSDKVIATGTPEQLASFNLKLAPYEIAVLVSVPEKAAPGPQSVFVPKTYAGTVSVREADGAIVVEAPGYTAEFNRAAGLLTTLKNADGVNVMTHADLLFAQRPELSDPECKIESIPTGKKLDIIRKNGNGQLRLSYFCYADKIELDASVSGTSGGEYVALTMPMADYRDGNWRVATMDGLLDDHFWETVKPSARIPGLKDAHNYRDITGTILWNSEVRIPDYANAKAGMYDRNGQGFEIVVADPLRNYPAMMQFRRRLGGNQTPGAILYLRSPSLLTAGLPDVFRVTLRCGDYREPWQKFSGKVDNNGVSLSGNSSDYIVENSYYRLILRRLNGAIRELVDKQTNKVVLRDFYTQRIGGSIETPGDKYDTDASMRFFIRDNTLMLRTCGLIPYPYAPGTPWCVTEYAFGPGAGFRSGRYLMIRESLSDVSYQVTGQVPAELSGSATRKGMEVRDGDRVLMTMQPTGYYNVYRTNEQLKMFALNKKHQAMPGQWTEFGCDFLFRADAVLPALSPAGWIQTKAQKLSWTPDLDIWGFAWSATEKGKVWHRMESIYPDLFMWTPGSIVPFSGFDRAETYNGKLSALLPGAWRRYDYKENFIPWFITLLPELAPGNYTVRFAAKFQNVRNPRSPFICKLIGYDENYKKIQIPLAGFDIPENADWKFYELRTTEPVPVTLRHAEVYFGVNCQSDAYSWISHIEVRKASSSSNKKELSR